MLQGVTLESKTWSYILHPFPEDHSADVAEHPLDVQLGLRNGIESGRPC